MDEKSRFREENFQKAMAVLQAEGGEEEGASKKKSGGGREGGKGAGQQSELGKIVRLIMERSYDPVIIFSFSKRECEAYALKMGKLDFNEEGEKELVEQVGREGRREGKMYVTRELSRNDCEICAMKIEKARRLS